MVDVEPCVREPPPRPDAVQRAACEELAGRPPREGHVARGLGPAHGACHRPGVERPALPGGVAFHQPRPLRHQRGLDPSRVPPERAPQVQRHPELAEAPEVGLVEEHRLGRPTGATADGRHHRVGRAGERHEGGRHPRHGVGRVAQRGVQRLGRLPREPSAGPEVESR